MDKKEYIERAAAMDAILGLTIADPAVAQYADAVCYHPQNLPAADVVEVRHGRWEPGNPICPVCGENKFKDLDADVWADWQPKFCPNCGARMDKEDEHEAD